MYRGLSRQGGPSLCLQIYSQVHLLVRLFAKKTYRSIGICGKVHIPVRGSEKIMYKQVYFDLIPEAGYIVRLLTGHPASDLWGSVPVRQLRSLPSKVTRSRKRG